MSAYAPPPCKGLLCFLPSEYHFLILVLLWTAPLVLGLWELVKYLSGPKNGGMDVVGELGEEEPK